MKRHDVNNKQPWRLNDLETYNKYIKINKIQIYEKSINCQLKQIQGEDRRLMINFLKIWKVISVMNLRRCCLLFLQTGASKYKKLFFGSDSWSMKHEPVSGVCLIKPHMRDECLISTEKYLPPIIYKSAEWN